ncbi:vWA domain-containing protein [Polyangium jinanense]|uniref:VWA domain-containing protein n=1 Tax=Polyangium jinanense TaxID=2829994 RepID=A0A9X4AY03_9BACT|nr:VWA domain-containing protein [Polyangium jinanense]MDC3955766.1 VWA domain-containing protein [Polyangium jinanense]MDC3986677.1 VWA domain-containing protein [Polyangium jinanense]
MKLRSLRSLSVLPLLLGSFGGTLAACIAVDSTGMSSGGYVDEASGGSGGGGPGPVGSVGVGSSSSGGSLGEQPPPDPVVPSPGADAGTDAAAEFTCEGLDSSKPVVLYLSADDSNSMGSPVHARELIGMGITPMAQEIRTYEFLNYYRIQYDAPAAGKLALYPELANTAVANELDFQIAVRSYDAVKPRRPMTVTFVLDVSGSMGGPGIERERAAVKAIAASLAEGDIVNAVTWDTNNNVVMSGHVVTGPNDPEIVSLANGLTANGGTDLHSGLVAGYGLAEQHYGSGRLNRVVLISDGGANVGETDAAFIGEKSKDADKEGIYLVGVGTGPGGSYDDRLMDIVTDKGRGAYVYLDGVDEASRMFVERFDETMEIAARGVQVELTMPWYFQMHKFYGEEYSENPEEVERQHLAPSDAMIFNQVLKACDPAQIVATDTITVRARWKTPLTYLDQETFVTTTVGDLLAAQKAGLPKAKAIVAFAEALKAPTSQNLADAHAMAVAANVKGDDPELLEVVSLIQKHPQY